MDNDPPSFIMTNEEHKSGITINVYNDIYSIAYGIYSEASGRVNLRWMYPELKTRKPAENAIPWAIRLGTKEQAIIILIELLRMLGIDVRK